MLSRTRLLPSGFIGPCLPSPAERPPSGLGWIHEIKHDGYRLMACRDAAGVRLLTRNGHDWASRFPLIVEAVTVLRVRSCLIDGEAVCCDDKRSGLDPRNQARWLPADGVPRCRRRAAADAERARLASRFPLIVEAVTQLRVRSCLIDGEAVCCDDNGVAVFAKLRQRRNDRHVLLYAFDLLDG